MHFDRVIYGGSGAMFVGIKSGLSGGMMLKDGVIDARYNI